MRATTTETATEQARPSIGARIKTCFSRPRIGSTTSGLRDCLSTANEANPPRSGVKSRAGRRVYRLASSD
jgi:hypothetical protein